MNDEQKQHVVVRTIASLEEMLAIHEWLLTNPKEMVTAYKDDPWGMNNEVLGQYNGEERPMVVQGPNGTLLRHNDLHAGSTVWFYFQSPNEAMRFKLSLD